MGGFIGCCSGGGGGGSGIGSSISFTSPSGIVDPSITAFSSTVGRIKLTLTANTTWLGLPAGNDAQQLFITVVSGNFLFTLDAFGATAQSQIASSANALYALNDTAQLFYDGGLTKWVLVL